MTERYSEPLDTIDEKHGVADVVFLAEFSKEDLRETEILRCFGREVRKFVRLRIDDSAQPVSLIAESAHDLVDGDVTGFDPSSGCESVFCLQV